MSQPTPLPVDIAARLATGLVVLEANLHVAWMNDAMGDLLEIGVRSLRGQPFASLLDVPDTLADAARRMREGETQVQWRHVRLTTLRHRERLVDLLMQALPDGRWLLEAHPLTSVPASSTPLSATLRGVAHEVKNPLAGLRGAAQLLRQRSTDADMQQLADVVMHEADRLRGLADRLLQHGQATRLGMVNLHEVLERIRRLMLAQTPELRVDEDYDPSLPAVHGDADRLQQLLLNLTGNAIEAGATALRLRTRVAHRVTLPTGIVRAAVRVDVIDNGPGVPRHLEDVLFQPLVSGRADGTGLGLALARETACDHGGDLCHAKTEEGTMFTLYLPLEPCHARRMDTGTLP
ncbi:MAG TPA: ATP-binding protein [Rhodanobacteraceae bacterium]|nr:ATP-binding protein [Rhodanobacteraceae bacterium]